MKLLSLCEIVMQLIGNRTSCRPHQSVIILVINKSDSRFTVVRFCLSLVRFQTKLDFKLNFVSTFKSILTSFRLSHKRSKKVLMSNQSRLYALCHPPNFPLKKVGTTPSSMLKTGTSGSCLRSMANLYMEICWKEGIKKFLLKQRTFF